MKNNNNEPQTGPYDQIPFLRAKLVKYIKLQNPLVKTNEYIPKSQMKL